MGFTSKLGRLGHGALSFSGLAVMLATLSAAPAQAQFFGNAWAGRFSFAAPAWDDGDWRDEPVYAPRAMPPRAVFRMLRREGYRVLGGIEPRGRVYVVNVADAESGQHERLIIDAFSGDVVQAYPLGQRVAPPGRVPLARGPYILVPLHPAARAPRPQAHARLTPSAPAAAPKEADDPLVIPGVGAGPSPIRKLKPIPRAAAPAKPKPVIARRAPADQIKRSPVAPAPVQGQPLPPVDAATPGEAAKPEAAPSVATAPPAPTLPATPPAAAKPATNDTPPAPLDEALPKPKTPVNDIPVAPLE